MIRIIMLIMLRIIKVTIMIMIITIRSTSFEWGAGATQLGATQSAIK